MNLTYLKRIALIVLVSFGLVGCFTAQTDSPKEYATWIGMDPDKWASIWLVSRYIRSDQQIQLVPVGAQISNAIPFGTPNAKFKRVHGISLFESLVKGHELGTNPQLLRLVTIIHQIEVSPWVTPQTIETPVVERAFRQLQIHYGRASVPNECYIGFFDALEKALTTFNPINETQLNTLAMLLSAEDVCNQPAEPAIRAANAVQEYPIANLIDLIRTGKKVHFVDAREASEFDLDHIPGASNLALRDVAAQSVKLFDESDLVIAYCIKDFRGYELARALHRQGVENVGIMKPYGIAGWKSVGFPTTEAFENESLALEQLNACVNGTVQCEKYAKKE